MSVVRESDEVVAVDRPGYRATVTYGAVEKIWTFSHFWGNEYVREHVVVREPIWDAVVKPQKRT